MMMLEKPKLMNSGLLVVYSFLQCSPELINFGFPSIDTKCCILVIFFSKIKSWILSGGGGDIYFTALFDNEVHSRWSAVNLVKLNSGT